MPQAANTPLRAKPGDSYRASDQQALADAVTRLGNLSVAGSGRVVALPNGTTIELLERERIVMLLTAVDGSGRHSWTEQLFDGSWSSGTRSGTPSDDPAYEINALAVPGFPHRVFAVRDPSSGRWLFQASQC